eukprot:CAMPEP_0170325064 /NCGR_PEP_ID=MMETSP0116_2-20130129/63391_1 /TAXON_ID=400756 /ORGANISM="Durinskia baltica, Strain CSIRO CS-38" /LENGTH=92 /DNA_ID=CAMNT_0010578085 /DNA_START=27 /DNA_END=302 /DNA_ORIENTATION=+
MSGDKSKACRMLNNLRSKVSMSPARAAAFNKAFANDNVGRKLSRMARLQKASARFKSRRLAQALINTAKLSTRAGQPPRSMASRQRSTRCQS